MDLLRRKFIENYNMEMVSTDLMYLIDEIDTTGSVLDDFINEKFSEDFTYEELYNLFKDEVSEEDLKDMLESMGFEYIKLDK